MVSPCLDQYIQIIGESEIGQILPIVESTHLVKIIGIEFPITMTVPPVYPAALDQPIVLTSLWFYQTTFNEPDSDRKADIGHLSSESLQRTSLSCHNYITSLLSI